MKTEILWFIHNAIAHPVMALFNILNFLDPTGLVKWQQLGLSFHDFTLPEGEE